MKSKRTAILCLCLALCLLAGCAKYPLGITVTCKDLQVTVPGDFVNLSEDSYAQDADFLYGWNTLVFMGLAEDKSKLQEMTLEEIGDRFGLTRERVRQIKEKAIRRLKQNQRSKLLKSYLG